MLAKAGHWQFDTFQLEDVTDGRPLSALAMYLFQEAGLVEEFKLDVKVLLRYSSIACPSSALSFKKYTRSLE